MLFRRGFTMSGQPLIQASSAIATARPDPKVEGDICSYYFWVVMIFVFVLSLVNLIVMLIIGYTYNVTLYGINHVEVVPEAGVVKFLRNITVDTLKLGPDGILTSFDGEPLEIISPDGGDIVFKINGDGPEMRISATDGVSFTNAENFRLVDPKTGLVHFDINHPEISVESPDLEELECEELETNRIVSPLGEDLRVKSDSSLDVNGAEGIDINGRFVELNAGGDIELKSTDEDITLDASQIHIDPRALPVGGGNFPGLVSQSKLCICPNTGLVFSVPAAFELPKGYQGQVPEIRCSDNEFWDVDPCEE